VTLILNGATPVPYVLTEYIDTDFLEARYGHREFAAFNTKSRTPPEIATLNPVAELRARFGGPENWTFERVSEVVDLDNLSRWFVAAIYCGTRDMWQGELVRDLSQPRAKWFWIAWDFDMSFGRPPVVRPYPVPQPDPVWLDDQFALHLVGPVLKRDERVAILNHLFNSSDAFRRYFANLFQSLRNDQLTPEFLDELMTKYEEVATTNGVTDTHYQDRIRQWFDHRPGSRGIRWPSIRILRYGKRHDRFHRRYDPA
jgi:hypothetical protein